MYMYTLYFYLHTEVVDIRHQPSTPSSIGSRCLVYSILSSEFGTTTIAGIILVIVVVFAVIVVVAAIQVAVGECISSASAFHETFVWAIVGARRKEEAEDGLTAGAGEARLTADLKERPAVGVETINSESFDVLFPPTPAVSSAAAFFSLLFLSSFLFSAFQLRSSLSNVVDVDIADEKDHVDTVLTSSFASLSSIFASPFSLEGLKCA